MDSSIASILHTRNRAIIDAILQKAAQCCPDALDLVAITGSFSRDEYYERSDLDLLIVINNPAGYQLAKCFALGDVAHDIYCQTWERLEHAASYPDPHVDKMLNAKIVYCREERVREVSEEDYVPVERYEVLMNEYDGNLFGEAVVEGGRRLAERRIGAEKAARVVLSKEHVSIDGGLLIRFGDVTCDCSLDTLLTRIYEKMKTELDRFLFED